MKGLGSVTTALTRTVTPAAPPDDLPAADGQRAATKRGATPLIDWMIAEKIAAYVAGEGDAPALSVELAPLATDAGRRVVQYTRLTPVRELPPPEGVGRREWISANLGSMRRMLDPVLDRAGEKLGPLKGARSLGVSVVSTIEIGVVVGFLAQRVLGQYELVLLEETSDDAPPRLLFVMPNLGAAVKALGAPGGRVPHLGDAARGHPRRPVLRRAVAAAPHGRARLRAVALDGAAAGRAAAAAHAERRRIGGSPAPFAEATSSASSPPRANARRSTVCRRRWP